MNNFWQSDQPLWLPRGSVRSLIALAIVLAALAGTLLGVESDNLWKSVFLVIPFYFAMRRDERRSNDENR